jgi:hypothetical protein
VHPRPHFLTFPPIVFMAAGAGIGEIAKRRRARNA